ncbi:myotubularin family phosphatidylinositol-3-phosphatase [Schizosaccharomyces octosporus yFS286]|uniref:Myotubularin family phosphatidylinositol-3-phosphatase n=1 Tax=Schizosaccharomyces octosporus (strain yFS286) TaxID=483514 RepID=S9R3W6_SCHOY|nr:myotubularin family phosphatidylinositol-3-phosphatase [Schizosaccharomyces octosporus yFS286]EPX73050.1 myotubularin family phosphatidylinositol-3-phosphatase [Schizosaccharomyces octosporus yFS286]
MENIKVAKVENVKFLNKGNEINGTLHLTAYHSIFSDIEGKREIWTAYSMINFVRLCLNERTYCIRVQCRDFVFYCLKFQSSKDAMDVYDTLRELTSVTSVNRLYAYHYMPTGEEGKVKSGWDLFLLENEYRRMGVGNSNSAEGAGTNWRLTKINENYLECQSYPQILAVPTNVSDSVIHYGCKYRSKNRFPTLTYLHKNSFSITRASQPLVGLRQNRSAQDEKIVEAIFATSIIPGKENLIVDARPSTNAMANIAVGAGSENMDHYRFAKKIYLGIDNIHVMRESLSKIVNALRNTDISAASPSVEQLNKSNWLKHLTNILQGAVLIIQTVHFQHAHVLVHCSDGWDRTSQLCALPQLCLDPHYRTIEGFMMLIEKDWLAFGHRFAERCCHLPGKRIFSTDNSSPEEQQTSSSVASSTLQYTFCTFRSALSGFAVDHSEKMSSPVFHQFLDCVWQIMRQFPKYFEFNERFLRRLLYHLYSCQYGSFLYNSQRERKQAAVSKQTRSIWDYFMSRKKEFTNLDYEYYDDVLLPNATDLKWWASSFGQPDENMNIGLSETSSSTESPPLSSSACQSASLRV